MELADELDISETTTQAVEDRSEELIETDVKTAEILELRIDQPSFEVDIPSQLSLASSESLWIHSTNETEQSFGLSLEKDIQTDIIIEKLETEIYTSEKLLEEVESPQLLDQFHAREEEDIQQILDVETHQIYLNLANSLELVSQGPTLPEATPYDFLKELEEWEEEAAKIVFTNRQLLQSYDEARRIQLAASYNFVQCNSSQQSEESINSKNRKDGNFSRTDLSKSQNETSVQVNDSNKSQKKTPRHNSIYFKRILTRRRSYSIDVRTKMIQKFKKLGFRESKPITLTVYDSNSDKSESYIRKMGKITGKKDNRSMTFSLGSDIGDLYNFNTEQKAQIKVMKNKMEITLEKQNYNYRFIITPGIDQTQKYSIYRAYTQISDYINTFSTKEIPILKLFGFKPSNDVLFNVHQKNPQKFLKQSVIRLGESWKVGHHSYQVKPGFPQAILKRFKFGNSRLIKFAIAPNHMILTSVRKDNPLIEEKEYNHYFTITPLKEKQVGISQGGLERINHYYSAYIGYEFERLGQTFLPYLFPKAQIHRQLEYQIKIGGEEKIIRPDATILEDDKPMTFVDFKKSIGAIRPRTLNYLRYFPKNHLIVCVLEEFGQSWEEKHIKNKLNKMKLNKTEKENILKRITVLHASDIANSLPKERKIELETKISKIQSMLPKHRLDALKNSKEITSNIIESLKELKISEEVIQKLNKPSRGILRTLQSLMILKRLVSSDYETVRSLAEYEGLKDKRMVQLRLRQLQQLGIVKERFFRVGLSNRHYYYYFKKNPPKLSEILGPQAVNGLKVLMKENYIPNKVDDKILQEIIGSCWLSALKISSIIDEKKIITIEDLTSENDIKIESHYQVLYALQKIGAVSHYRIYRALDDHKVAYFFTHDFPRGLTLSDQIKFLKPYQKNIINMFKKKGLEIPELNAFNEWLGDHWLVALRIYNLALTDEDLPQTTNKTKIFNLYDLVQRMDESSEGIRKALAKLEEIGVLDKYPWFEKSYYFQFEGTDPISLTENPLLPKNIQKTLRSIEKASNIQFQDLAHLREIMTRHWRNSLRIYNILSKNKTSYSTGISRDNLIEILKRHNIILKNLARYIKPLKDTGVLFTYTHGRQMFYQLRH
ncbi:MAG: hypothetical protein ACFE9L_17890 [Candidatus Hodarchaeota archaeon]